MEQIMKNIDRVDHSDINIANEPKKTLIKYTKYR